MKWNHRVLESFMGNLSKNLQRFFSRKPWALTQSKGFVANALKPMINLVLTVILLGGSTLTMAQSGGASGGAIVGVDAQLVDQDITIRLTAQGSLGRPEGFVMSNPNRVILDFNQAGNGTGKNLHPINLRFLRDVQFAQAGAKLRMVINTDARVKYELKSSGQELFVVLRPEASVAGNLSQKYPSGNLNTPGSADIIYTQTAVSDVRFRRGEKGEGKLVITFSNENMVPDIAQRGDGVLVQLKNTSIPVRLRQKLDVLDFATPVKAVEVNQDGSAGKIQLFTKGLWEYTSYQVNNVLIIEVVPVEYDPNKLTQGNRKEYKGEKLSLNFQNVDIRSILQVIADFRDINIITSDSVGGSLTLRLKDVPWDQALDLILSSKDLGMDKNGNVVHIAPKAELNAQKRLEIENQNRLDALQPLKTEVFKIKYHKATAIRGILQERTAERGNNLLSANGSAVPDERTNTLIVRDYPDKLQSVRDLLALIDVALPQVMIEARIVSTSNSFSESFKPKLALLRPGGGTIPTGAQTIGNYGVTIGGKYSSATAGIGTGTTTATGTTDGFVDFVAGNNTPGSIGFAIFDKAMHNVLGLEIDALETEGLAKTISNPRVVTQTNKAATISSGVQIPYQSAAENGATTTSFVSANLSLSVTPQVTPDGKVLLTVSVNDSSPAEGGQISTKNISTEVLVENGGTLVVGGIYIQSNSKSESRIPFFSGLPIIGKLFRGTTNNDAKNEFLVFLTPRILADGGVSFSN